MDTERGDVELPPSVRKQCESRIEGTEFETVEEYVTFVLETLFEQADDDVFVENETNDDAMKERLESLGYI